MKFNSSDMPCRLMKIVAFCAALSVSILSTPAADPATTPIKALFFVGGGYHDYAKLAPHLTSKLSELANVTLVTKDSIEPLIWRQLEPTNDEIAWKGVRFLKQLLQPTRPTRP